MASIATIYSTYNAIQVQLIGLDTSYNQTTRTCKWTLNGQTKTTTLANGVSSGGTVTFTGLKSGSRYSVSVTITAPADATAGFNGLNTSLSGYVYTAAFPVSKWSWTSSTARSNAYNALMNKGSLSNFNYTVWNEMVDAVYNVCDTVSHWDSSYGGAMDTKMSISDKILTAKRFNALRFNIGRHVSTDINDVSTGDIVYGSYFITLMEKLNTWISMY